MLACFCAKRTARRTKRDYIADNDLLVARVKQLEAQALSHGAHQAPPEGTGPNDQDSNWTYKEIAGPPCEDALLSTVLRGTQQGCLPTITPSDLRQVNLSSLPYHPSVAFLA